MVEDCFLKQMELYFIFYSRMPGNTEGRDWKIHWIIQFISLANFSLQYISVFHSILKVPRLPWPFWEVSLQTNTSCSPGVLHKLSKFFCLNSLAPNWILFSILNIPLCFWCAWSFINDTYINLFLRHRSVLVLTLQITCDALYPSYFLITQPELNTVFLLQWYWCHAESMLMRL